MSFHNIDLSGLPFDTEGQPLSFPEPDKAKERTFKRLHPTTQTKPPILLKYTNWQTLAYSSIEVPERPIRAAIEQDRPLVVYYVNDMGVFATRFDSSSLIRQAIMGKRFMPHFPNAPAWVVADNPDGFHMLIMRLELDDFVELEHYPDKTTKLKLEKKTRYQLQQIKSKQYQYHPIPK